MLPPPEVLVVLTTVEKEGKKDRTVICFQIVSRVIF